MISMYGRRLAITAAAILLAACADDSEQGLLASAKAYLDKHDAKAAVIQLKNAVEKNPKSGEVRALLGRALLESGDTVGAELELQRADALDYHSPSMLPWRAKALMAQAKYAKVVRDFEGLEIADPGLAAEIQTLVANAYLAQGMTDDAVAAVDKALIASRQYAAAIVLKSRLTAAKGDVDGALKRLDDLLATAPSDADAWQLKADLLFKLKAADAAAVEAYRKVLAIDNSRTEAHMNLASLHLARHDLVAAGQQVEELKRLGPKRPSTQFFEAKLAAANGDYKHAHDVLQPVLQALPNNVMVMHLAGGIDYELGSLASAESLLGRALKLSPASAPVRRLLAQTYLKSHKPSEALAVLAPLLEPDVAPDPDVLSYAAQAHLQAGDLHAAKTLHQHAAKLKPHDKGLSAAVIFARFDEGNPRLALAELRTLAADDKDVTVDMGLIVALIERREFEQALAAIDKLEAKQPDGVTAPMLRGRIHLLRADMAAARSSFMQAFQRDPKHVPAVAALAALDMRDGHPETAQSRFEALLKLDPKNIKARLGYTELQIRRGMPKADIERSFDDAVAAAASDSATRLAQIDYLWATKDVPRALAAAQSAAAALPENIEVLDRLGHLHLASGDREQALNDFRKIVSLAPSSAAGYLGLADVHIAGKNFDAARAETQHAIEHDPDSTRAYQHAVAIGMSKARVRDSLAAARELQTRRPDEAMGFIAEGGIEASQQHWDAAVAAYRKALTKSGGDQAAAGLHEALISAKQTAEATRFADGWTKEHPGDLVFLLQIADATMRRGDFAAAQVRFQAVVHQMPDNAVALNNLAWLLMQQKKPGALQYAERAVKAAPDQVDALDTLALAQAAEKQYAEAIKTQRRAVAKALETPGLRLTLAKIYLLAGDKAQGITELDALSKLGTQYVGHDEVQRLLKVARAP